MESNNEKTVEEQTIGDKQDARSAQADKLYQTGVMLIHGKRKSVEKAIKCIQKAITLVDSDYKYWRLLGEAYYQRGSLNPSINCFMKSLALAEKLVPQDDDDRKRVQADCTYSRLRMSDIRLSVSHLIEAANGYSDIISENPDNVAALVGMAKVELQQAKNCFTSGLIISGHDHCMNALRYSLEAIKLDPHLCLSWKLASDCCLTQFIQGQRGPFSSKINVQFPGSDEDGLSVNRLTCIELAQQFLCKALAIEPCDESACLWHNLGISIYLKSTIVTSNQEREKLLKRSLKCLFKALNQDRNNSQMRNSIGVVAFNLNYLNTAQNFFIKSIRTNLSTSEIQFSNLGYVYLQKGEYRLASVAFSRSQAEEPLYGRSWLGNALINEQNNLDNLSYLRHCHKLENNYQSQVMYATKVTSLPFNEEYKKDLINALGCMRRVINYNQVSLDVNNTLGLLFERCGFHDQAKIHFDNAYTLAPQDSRVIFNKLRQHNATSSCYAQDQAMELDTEFIKAAEKLSVVNREYLLNYIYYLFNNKDYANIGTKMTRILEKIQAEDVNNKVGAQIVLALAAKAEGGDFKSWLFKNIIDSENVICLESLVNMLCLVLFGSTTGDHQLVEQISTNLKSYLISYLSTRTKKFSSHFYSHEGTWIRLVLISSIFCSSDRGKLIQTLVALYPTVADLWLYLGLSLISSSSKSNHQTAIFCFKKASLIGSTQSDLCVICDILLAILMQQVKFKTADNSNLDTRIIHLSRAIYKKPDDRLLWKSLRDSRDLRARNVLKKNQPPDENDPGLYQLALDLTLRTAAAS